MTLLKAIKTECIAFFTILCVGFLTHCSLKHSLTLIYNSNSSEEFN